MDLTDTYRTLHLKTVGYAFSSSAHGTTFFRIDHMLSHKKSLSKFKIKIIPSILFDHNRMKLKINYKKKNGKRQTHGG